MADIMMCKNEECVMKDSCLRYLAQADKFYQSYMMYPEKDCVEIDYQMYWEK